VAARIVTLIAALVVAAIGAALVIAYALEADRRAQAQFADVQVVVANQYIREGTLLRDVLGDGEQGAYLQIVPVSESSLIPDAWIDRIPGGREDLAFRTDVFPGDQISDDKLGEASGVADPLALANAPTAEPGSENPGRAAIVLALTDEQRGSSWLQPGARVAVLLDEPGAPPEVPGRTCVLAPEAWILAVGDETAAGVPSEAGVSGGNAAAGTTTQEVPPGFVAVEVREARFALAMTRARDGGTLSFVLRPQVGGPDFLEGSCLDEAALNGRLGLPVG
jgi:pilus assembly protein CpaB